MCECLYVKYLLLMSDFDKSWLVETDFLKVLKYEIVHWEPSYSMRPDRQLVAAFRNFCESA
jgi:hypothetical protein